MRVPRPMITCRWNGSVATISGALLSDELSDGTSRQPSTVWPSSSIIFSTTRSILCRSDGSCGMKMNADRVVAGRGQGDALLGHLLDEEGVRDLHHDAGAVAHQRIGAHGAAMLEVLENIEAALSRSNGSAGSSDRR